MNVYRVHNFGRTPENDEDDRETYGDLSGECYASLELAQAAAEAVLLVPTPC